MTYPKYGRVIMDTPKGGCGFIDRQIFYFRGTEDDVLVRFLNRWDELGRRPVLHEKTSGFHL